MKEVVENILHIFKELNKIPRKSEQEEKIHNWLVSWANENGFKYRADEALNINILIPGTKGMEKLPSLVLQGHMDMVCEKVEGSNHDFSKDPITHIIKGDWLSADGTSLGADNGIAIALSLAVALDKEMAHPPLEILITSAEETGLLGANALKQDFVDGKILLNLDSEDEGVFTVGCAGGNDTIVNLSLQFEAIPQGLKCFQITLAGLQGGHSGVDINNHRESANVLITRVLKDLRSEMEAHLVNIKGGTAHNALARTATAVVAVKDKKALSDFLTSYEQILKIENSVIDTGIFFEIAPASAKLMVSESCSVTVLNLLMAIPHGVQRMSSAIEGLVQTSNNIAVVELGEIDLFIHCSQRSSVMSDLKFMSQRIEAAAQLAGAKSQIYPKYPAWMPNMDSPLLKRCEQVYESTFGIKPVVEAIHAGLECGVIGAVYEGMDMISFGPHIRDCHSPDERLEIPTLGKIWEFMVALFASFGEK